MPKIGMPSCAVLSAPLKKAVEIGAENDFDAFEINCLLPTVNLDLFTPENIAELRNIAEVVNMEFCVHAPFFELNIAALNQGIRKESVNYVNKSIELCADLGGSVVIVHSGEYTYRIGPDASRDNNPNMNRQWNNNIESLKKINEHAVNQGVIVCLENLGFEKEVAKSFEDLIETQNAMGKSLQFTLDLGHARLNANIQEGIDTLGDSIRHIHLTDNFGEKDDHLPPGEGDSDYSGVAEYLKSYPHIVTLEVVAYGIDPGPMIRGREFFNQL
jgi:sugar phosphate isomerase/epimerase